MGTVGHEGYVAAGQLCSVPVERKSYRVHLAEFEPTPDGQSPEGVFDASIEASA
jgi:hypothetical protein